MYDIQEIKQAAAGRWAEIFQSLAGVDRQILNGKHHPCPKCGGNDRFRAIEIEVGGLFCNHCFSSKNRDGIAAIAWLLDLDPKKDFVAILTKLAEYLGVKEQPRPSKKAKSDPAKDLKFTNWNPTLAGLWCLKKKPITVASLELIGARMAVYKGEFKVIALPIWRVTPDKITGWYVMNANGGTLPGADGKPVKGKSTAGSKTGLIGLIDSSATTIYKTEGPTDLLALVGILSGESCGVTNSCGTKENPKNNFSWLPELINGKEIRVIHDADKPGQDGATWVESSRGDRRPGWSPWLAAKCPDSVVKNVLLPYEIEPTKGKDIRDWLTDGGNLDGLQTLVDAAEQTEPVEEIEEEIIEAVDDPHRLARVNLESYWNKKQRKIVYWNGKWMVYRDGTYVETEPDRIEAGVTAGIKAEFDKRWRFEFEEYENNKKQPDYEPDSDKGPPQVRKVNLTITRNVIAAIRSMVTLSMNTEIETWLPTGERKSYISTRNGILDLDTYLKGDTENCLMPHTPDWFSLTKVSFDFDPSAECHEWKKFITQVFTDEKNDNQELAKRDADEQANIIQMFSGYCLTCDTFLEKILFLEGPRRSGKGTYLKIMHKIIGRGYAAATFSTLSSKFGVENLMGKRLAVLADARVSKKSDLSVGLERLLSISSNDPIPADQKFIAATTVQLFTKIIIATNEIPEVKDPSGAFASRMVCLHMPNSYAGREDYDLQPRLFEELPGILNWYLEGLRKLIADPSSFRQPEASRSLSDDFLNTTSPIREFIDECLIEVAGSEIRLDQIHYCHRRWVKDEIEKGNKAEHLKSNVLSRQLNQAIKTFTTKRLRLTGETKKVTFVYGVALSETWSKYSVSWNGPNTRPGTGPQIYRSSDTPKLA